jgi:thiol-disulfide isomerase/thioredoxin
MGRESNKKRRADAATSARQKAAAARAAQQRAEQRRRAVVILSSILAVAIVGGGIAAYAVTRPNHTTAIANNRADAPASVVDAIRNVPVATLDGVGKGTIITPPSHVSGTALTSDGKPELLYIGAEFCPYCAAERWSMAAALSRFGTLNGIKLTKSASDDTDPNTATLDFIGASYTSKYLTFTPVENEDRNRNKLEPVSSTENALWNKYTNNSPGYPFLDFGNKYVVSGPTYDPQVLAGLTQAQIASKLADPSDPVAKSADGAANELTAAICGITNNRPASVCSDPVVSGLETSLNQEQVVPYVG